MAKAKTRRDFGCIRQVDSSARWQASYPNPDDKSRRINGPTTFADRDDAVFWLTTERRMIESGTWKHPQERRAAEVTLQTYGTKWLERHKVRDSTRNLYRARLEDLVFPALGHRRLSSLTSDDIENWHMRAVRDGSASSVGTAYTALSSMLSSAADAGVIARNPCRLKNVRGESNEGRTRAATAAELRLISKAMRPEYEALVLIAGWCGLRWGEVTGLRRSDVDLKAKVVTVYEAISVAREDRQPGAKRAGKPHAPAKFVRGKVKTSGSERKVDIPPHIIPAIRHHLDTYVDARVDALLFRSVRSKDRPVSGSTFHKWFREALAKADVPEMRVHDLRHTAATLAMETGQASGFDVMARLGHTSQKTAARYQHVQRDRQRNLAAALSDLAAAADLDL